MKQLLDTAWKGRAVYGDNLLEASSNLAVADQAHTFPKILVIDDEDPILSMIEDMLHMESYTVLLAGNGKIGLLSALEAHPDLILTDIMMPLMDGRELCRHLRSDAYTAQIPVIAMSAVYQLQSDDLFDAVIAKPFDILSLLSLIHTQLAGLI